MSILGGIERVLSLKMNYLADKSGYKVYFITSDQNDNNFSYSLSRKIEHINLNGVRYFSIYKNAYPKRLYNIVKFNCDFSHRLKKVLSMIHPDIVVCNTTFMASTIVKLHIGSKIVVESHLAKESILKYNTFQTGIFYNFLRRFFDFFYCLELKKCDKFVLLTKEDYNAWKNMRQKVIIPNPIPIYPNSITKSNSKTIICVGRLNYEKGYDMLINAWSKIAFKHQEWKINIYGSGPLHDDLSRMILDKGLKASVKINSSTPAIYEKYLESEFLVLSSRAEGFALVLAESMAFGKPCVAFNCPSGPNEIIDNGVNGLLAINGDVDDLANKIEWMINHEKERYEMGVIAHNSVKQYTLDEIMNKWIMLFNDLT